MDPHYRLPSDPGEMPIKLIFSDKTKLYNYSYIGCMYTYYIFRKKCRHKQPLKLMRKNFFDWNAKLKSEFQAKELRQTKITHLINN